MKIIFALGNPGNKYERTRHNAGFMLANALASKLDVQFSFESKFNAEIAKCEYNSQSVWIIKPQTFMNLSGQSVRAFINFYKTDVKDLFVVYDDISLDVGKIRFRAQGSDGGHNGIKSIISNVATQQFDRLKIGIGPQPPYMKSEDFVLGNFSEEQMGVLSPTINRAVDAVLFYIDNDLYKAQNKFNS